MRNGAHALAVTATRFAGNHDIKLVLAEGHAVKIGESPRAEKTLGLLAESFGLATPHVRRGLAPFLPGTRRHSFSEQALVLIHAVDKLEVLTHPIPSSLKFT